VDVYVIPIGRDRYELYCEPAGDSEAEIEGETTAGVFGRLRTRFTQMVRAAEERQREEAPPRTSWLSRLQDRVLGWVALRIAEQRLLWNLRRCTSAQACHPQDMTFDQVMALITDMLKADYKRHRQWLVIDAVGFAASGLVFLVPGPNVIAYFFAFRLVGHWLSMRGANQGLHHVSWSGRSCPPLAELRDLHSLDPSAREQRIQRIADCLKLQHLAAFFARVSVRPA
jgi:hypothetical protein